MAENSGFLVEDFIQSITAQLDHVQDVLRLKALSRPLTYALKDFSLDLHVFVDLDEEGNVRFRTSGPNESGASVVRLGFTTITKPMIEENTVSLSLTKSPTLDELGLGREESKRLGQLGVRNAAQLQQLRESTSTTTIARFSGVPVDRLRNAMRLGQPFVKGITPVEPGPSAPTPRPQPPLSPPQTAPLPVQDAPPVRQPPQIRTPFAERGPSLPAPSIEPAQPPERLQPAPALRPPTRAPLQQPRLAAEIAPEMPAIRVAPDTAHLRLSGGNLLNAAGPPIARLAGEALPVDIVDDDEMWVELPLNHEGGPLEIQLPQGETLTYNLSVDWDQFPQSSGEMHDDPWTPQSGGG